MRHQRDQFKRATHEVVTHELLSGRTEWALERGYAKAKWVFFCEALMSEGYELTLYEARKTFSKYITVRKSDRSFKVRFSNHRPIKAREMNGDCDFFVGVTHTGYRDTDQAIEAVRDFFGSTKGDQ